MATNTVCLRKWLEAAVQQLHPDPMPVARFLEKQAGLTRHRAKRAALAPATTMNVHELLSVIALLGWPPLGDMVERQRKTLGLHCAGVNPEPGEPPTPARLVDRKNPTHPWALVLNHFRDAGTSTASGLWNSGLGHLVTDAETRKQLRNTYGPPVGPPGDDGRPKSLTIDNRPLPKDIR